MLSCCPIEATSVSRREEVSVRDKPPCLSRWSNQVSYSYLTSRNLTLVHPHRRLMTLYESFLTDNTYPGGLLNALCHPVTLNHSTTNSVCVLMSGETKNDPNGGMGVDECNRIDKETEFKPDVIFLGVHLEL